MAWQNLYRMLNGLGQVEIYFGIPQLKAICPKSKVRMNYHSRPLVFELLFQNATNFLLDSY